MIRMNRKLNVAVIGTKGIPAQYGGFETCVHETGTRLVKDSVKLTVYCRKIFSEIKICNFRGINLKYVSSINTKNLSTISSTFLSVIKELASDNNIIHIYTAGNAVFIPLLKLFGKRCVISIDALDWKRKKWGRFASWFIKTSEIIAVKTANSIISDSQVICKYYQEKYKRNIDYVAFGGNIDNDIGKESLILLNLCPKKYFLFVGIFRLEKNVELLINAFKKSKTKDYVLVLIGDDPINPEYVSYLHSLKSDKVKFLGRLYGKVYEEILKNSYCYVTASEVEGTSPSLLAAMGFGITPLVSDIPENLETVGDTGFSFKVNDEKDLIKQIEYLIENQGEVIRRGGIAQERVKSHYSWNLIAAEFKKIYIRIAQ